MYINNRNNATSLCFSLSLSLSLSLLLSLWRVTIHRHARLTKLTVCLRPAQMCLSVYLYEVDLTMYICSIPGRLGHLTPS